MTTRKIREYAINDRRGRGEGLYGSDVCRSFNLLFEHFEGELLNFFLGILVICSRPRGLI